MYFDNISQLNTGEASNQHSHYSHYPVTSRDDISANIPTLTSCQIASVDTIATKANMPIPQIKWIDK